MSKQLLKEAKTEAGKVFNNDPALKTRAISLLNKIASLEAPPKVADVTKPGKNSEPPKPNKDDVTDGKKK